MLFEKYYPLAKTYTLLEPNPRFEPNYKTLARKHANLEYEISTFEAFKPERKFDAIVMMAVIAHIRMKWLKIDDRDVMVYRKP